MGFRSAYQGGLIRALPVVAVVVLAAVLRLPSLLHDGLWRDQANVYIQVSAPSLSEFFDRVTATEWHPPLYFLTAYVWAKATGTSEIALTLLSFACALATVVCIYWLGSVVRTRTVGLIASFLYAVSPLAIAYATEYVYPFAALVFTLLAVAVVLARARPARSWLIAAGVLSILAVYSHYTALPYIVALASWCVFKARRVAAALAAGPIAFAAWLPVFENQMRIGMPYAHQLTFAEKVEFIPSMAMKMIPVDGTLAQIFFVIFFIAALVVVAAGRSPRSGAFALVVIFVGMLCTAVFLNLLEARYIVPVYGLFCVFMASVIDGLVGEIQRLDAAAWRPRRVLLAALGAFALLLPSAEYAVRNSAVPKSGIRTLLLSTVSAPRSFYVVAPDYLASTFAYYARKRDVTFTGFVRRDRPEIFRLRGYSDDWNREDAVKDACAIESAAAGYRYLDLVVDDQAADLGRVRYGKVWTLLRTLQRRHRLMSRTKFPGRNEYISDYRFALNTGRPLAKF